MLNRLFWCTNCADLVRCAVFTKTGFWGMDLTDLNVALFVNIIDFIYLKRQHAL
jgi:hypothetical protein